MISAAATMETATAAIRINAEQLQGLVLNALADMKAKEVSALPVRELTSMCDYMVICTGTSGRHVKAMAERVVQNAKAQDCAPLGVEGDAAGEWVLIDLADVIVHVMTREARDYYQLEKLWDSNRGLTKTSP